MVESYGEQIGRRIIQQNKNNLEEVRNIVSKGDYGKALTAAYVGRTIATLYKDRETRKAYGDLALHISRFMEEDFDDYARQNCLIVTEENKRTLMMEHSRHWIRCVEISEKVHQIIRSLEDHLDN